MGTAEMEGRSWKGVALGFPLHRKPGSRQNPKGWGRSQAKKSKSRPGKRKVPTVEGNLLDSEETRVGRKSLLISGCISQTSMEVQPGIYAEPLWGLVNTEHTGPQKLLY